jgi:KDO2-lipid IV(A) lauroyltransferase
MARPRNKLADWMQYAAARVFGMFVNMFDCRTNYRTACIAGDLLYLLDGKHRRIAVAHLRRSFPSWSDSRVRTVARESMRSLVHMAFEFVTSQRLITPESWRRHTVLTNQDANVRMLIERKHGIVYIGGHFGNWERVGYTMAILGFEGFAVARPLDNAYLDDYVKRVRQLKGMTIIDKKGAAARMDEILTSRRYVGFIADQDAGRRGLFVDFFGRQASTNKAPALVAMRYEVPVVVGYGRRMDDGARFEIGIERIIHPSEWAGKDDPVRWITREYTRAMEATIRRTPEQYLWAHRRWKHRPRGEPPAAGGVA